MVSSVLIEHRADHGVAEVRRLVPAARQPVEGHVVLRHEGRPVDCLLVPASRVWHGKLVEHDLAHRSAQGQLGLRVEMGVKLGAAERIDLCRVGRQWAYDQFRLRVLGSQDRFIALRERQLINPVCRWCDLDRLPVDLDGDFAAQYSAAPGRARRRGS